MTIGVAVWNGNKRDGTSDGLEGFVPFLLIFVEHLHLVEDFTEAGLGDVSEDSETEIVAGVFEGDVGIPREAVVERVVGFVLIVPATAVVREIAVGIRLIDERIDVGAGLDDVLDEEQAVLQFGEDCELMVGVCLVVAAGEIEAGDADTALGERSYVGDAALVFLVAELLGPDGLDEIVGADVTAEHRRDEVGGTAAVWLDDEPAVGEEGEVAGRRARASHFLAHEEGHLDGVVLREAFETDEDAVLVVGSESLLLVAFGRISGNDVVVFDADEITGVSVLHLIHVGSQAGICVGQSLRDEEIAGLVLHDACSTAGACLTL